MNSSGNSPGWYADPLREGRLRYFDGANWTDEVCDPPTAASPPEAAGWYPDPLDRTRQRFFNGARWTDAFGSGGTRPSKASSNPAVESEADAVSGNGPPVVARADQRVTGLMAWLTRSPQIFVVGAIAVAATVATALLVSLLVNPDRGIEATEAVSAPSTDVPPTAPTLRPSPSEPPTEDGTGEDTVAAPANESLTTQEVNSILRRVMPDWTVRSISPSPESLAVEALLSESSDAAARAGGNFMAAMIYRDSTEPRSASEIRFLEAITDEFRFNYPYQNWIRMQCGNVVILVADLGAEFIVDEMPSFISCRPL